jgi:hypothetical protein
VVVAGTVGGVVEASGAAEVAGDAGTVGGDVEGAEEPDDEQPAATVADRARNVRRDIARTP